MSLVISSATRCLLTTVIYFAGVSLRVCDIFALQVYKWCPTAQRYQHLQAIATDGAHAAEFFIIQQQLYLAIANFGDRHNRRYDAESAVYQYKEVVRLREGGKDPQCTTANAATADGAVNDLSVDISADGDRHAPECRVTMRQEQVEEEGGGTAFQLQITIATMGATDWEYFELVDIDSGHEGGGADDRHSFLAVSEEADMKRGVNSPFLSRIYRVQV